MPVTVLAADQFADRINHYVPAMSYDAAIQLASPVNVNFGSPIVADANGILAAQSIAAVGSTTTFASSTFTARTDGVSQRDVMGKYGRCVDVVASGTATSKVAVHGKDYLGQRMTEEFTLNGTTAVNGVKAFAHIDLVEYEATASRTIDVGWSNRLGLPYKTIAALREFEDDVLAAAGTFVAAVTTDPATATTGDPRGTYVPTGTLDGTAEFVLECRVSNNVNSDSNGGLHGIKHHGVASQNYS